MKILEKPALKLQTPSELENFEALRIDSKQFLNKYLFMLKFELCASVNIDYF